MKPLLRRLAVTAAVAAVALAPACGSTDDTSDATTTAPAEADGPQLGEATVGDVEITEAWARSTAPSAPAGAVYMHLESAVDDALVGASVPSSVAATVEIHETRATEDDMAADDGGGGMSGEMEMAPMDELALPSGEVVVLEPGGYHLMLLDLAAPLESGTEIEVTLELEQAGKVTVSVPVVDDAA